jgi:hypothetical protein
MGLLNTLVFAKILVAVILFIALVTVLLRFNACNFIIDVAEPYWRLYPTNGSIVGTYTNADPKIESTLTVTENPIDGTFIFNDSELPTHYVMNKVAEGGGPATISKYVHPIPEDPEVPINKSVVRQYFNNRLGVTKSKMPLGIGLPFAVEFDTVWVRV